MSSPPSNPASTRSTPSAVPRARAGPRAGVTRKTKAEREKYAAEQADRDKKRVTTTSSPAQAAARGGRGTARGGRGGVQREASHNRIPGTSAGVFGSVAGTSRTREAQRGFQGQEEWLTGGSGPPAEKKEGDESADAGTTKKSAGAAQASSAHGTSGTAPAPVPQRITEQAVQILEDDDPTTERRDIERIWISSDEEDYDEDDEDIIASKGKQRATSMSVNPKKGRRSGGGGGGLRPVRAPRLHAEDGAREHDKSTDARTGRSGKRETTAAPIILDDSGDAMDIDSPQSTSAQQRRAAQFPSKDISTSPELRKRSLSKNLKSRSRDAKLHASETIEERAERLRVAEDTNRLMDIFSQKPSDHSSIPTSAATGRSRAVFSPENRRLLLMQFPPLTPMLIDPVADAAAAAAAATEADTTADANANDNEVQIKAEPDASSKSALHQRPQPANPSLLTAADATAPSQVRLPAGLVGKLKVHASGKISLDWGGVDMEVKWGSEVDFLQDAVLLDSDGVLAGAEEGQRVEGSAEADEDGGEGKGDRKATKDDGQHKGKAYALGQVMGKLVVVPDWAKLYD